MVGPDNSDYRAAAAFLRPPVAHGVEVLMLRISPARLLSSFGSMRLESLYDLERRSKRPSFITEVQSLFWQF
jgi:hypothetical protein